MLDRAICGCAAGCAFPVVAMTFDLGLSTWRTPRVFGSWIGADCGIVCFCMFISISIPWAAGLLGLTPPGIGFCAIVFGAVAAGLGTRPPPATPKSALISGNKITPPIFFMSLVSGYDVLDGLALSAHPLHLVRLIAEVFDQRE